MSAADIAAFVDFGGNVAAVYRARAAAIAGRATAAGVPIDPVLLEGWAGAPPVGERSLYRAFEQELTPAFVAGVTGGERARRTKLVYLRREASFRNQVWEGDYKNLPVLVLPPRGKACTPWVTMFLDDATRVITGWAISLTPHAGTVLTALRMAWSTTRPPVPRTASRSSCAWTRVWSSPRRRSVRRPLGWEPRPSGCPATNRTRKARSSARS
ncbi:hypothetical protein [Spirillospora sp. CA-128828]|uniref:hypothetical protein n=1 Tax=Spirillospora sp. CA-128828 TaxID=3240033 RepID=UPI003D8DF7E5